jgi:hypothetical protein
MTLDTRITRYTAGLLITPAQAIYVKLGYEYWTPNDVGVFRTPPASAFPAFHSAHVGFGGAF